MECVNWVLRVIGFVTAPGLFFSMKAQTIQIDWAKGFGGNQTEVGKAVTADVLGNSYCVGYFNGMMDADPGPANLPLVSAGMQDVFLAKTSAAGQTLWARKIGGSQGDMANGVTLDHAGNVYITGSFRGSVDFDPGIATYTLNTFSPFSQDIFVAKYDQNGSFQWAVSFGGEGYFDSLGNVYDGVSSGYAIQFDKTGSLYLTGSMLGCIDFDPGPGVDTLSARFSASCFIVKLDLNGNLRWAKQLGGGLHGVEGYGIQYHAGEAVYVCGVFGDSVDFDPGPNTWWMRSMAYSQAFVSKLDSNGQFIWARQLGGTTTFEQATAQSIDIDGYGNVLLGGHFTGSGDFDPGLNNFVLQSNGQMDCFLVKLDANGQLLWCRQTGGPKNDYCYSVSIGMNGLIYTTGNFRGSADFDPGYLTHILSSTTLLASDLYVCCFTGSGSLLDAVRVGGNGGDGGNAVYANNTGLVNICGYLGGPASVQILGQPQWLPSSGGIDVLLAQFKELIPVVLSPVSEARMAQQEVCEISGPVNVDAPCCNPIAGRWQEPGLHQRPLVYPIPGKRVFTIEFPVHVEKASLKMINPWGVIVYREEKINGKKFRFDAGVQCPGNYILDIVSTGLYDGRIHTDKIKIMID